MTTLSDFYRLKEDPISGKKWDHPTSYLGANIGKHKIDGLTKEHWYMSADDYVKASVANVEQELLKTGKKLGTKVTGVISSGYRPELDTTVLLGPEAHNYYQNLIGVLRWAVELGRIDIHAAVSMLSQYLAQPRQGHLDQALHIFAYLKKHSLSKIVFDDTYITWKNKFTEVDWTDFYPNAAESIPLNAPEARQQLDQINFV